jgi:hypothetical protein
MSWPAPWRHGLCADLLEVVIQSHELLTSVPVLRELKRIHSGKLSQSEEITQGFIHLLSTLALFWVVYIMKMD